ncbi:hypothetical protein SPHINGO8AM_30204 [Sphingomonas sp. 8AM]|nr:hypothetical protein SPHINGO8AM_30204 [Sphingomonas sp. 8AM]
MNASRTGLRVLTRGPVLAALALTVVGAGAMFTVFTYIVPILREETQASTGFVTAMLALYGTGLTMGNTLGGRLADRSIERTLMGCIVSCDGVDDPPAQLAEHRSGAEATALLECSRGQSQMHRRVRRRDVVPRRQVHVMRHDRPPEFDHRWSARTGGFRVTWRR